MAETVDAGQLQATLTLNASQYIATLQAMQAEARAAQPNLNISAGGGSGFGSVAQDARAAAAAQNEAAQAALNFGQRMAALRAERAAQAQAAGTETAAETANTEAVLRGTNARLAAAQSEAEFREARHQANVEASMAAAQNSALAASTDGLSAAERQAMEVGRVSGEGRSTAMKQAIADRQAEMSVEREATTLQGQLGALMRSSTSSQDELGRATRITSQELKNGTTAVTAMVAGYNEAGEKVVVLARSIGTFETASRAASAEAKASADALSLVGKEAETSGSSMFRLGGSVNDTGMAHLRLYGPLGLVAAGLAIVGGAALKEAADLETATIRTENFGNASAATSQKLESGLNHNLGMGSQSAVDYMTALAPVSGVLAQLDGGALQAASGIEVLRSAEELSLATGEKLDAVTRSEVETLRAFGLTARDTANVESALYDSSVKSGQSVATEAQRYEQLRQQLAEFKPTLAEVKALNDAANEPGGGGVQATNELISAYRSVTAETDKAYEARRKYDIQVRDSSGATVSLTTFEQELARAIQGKTEQQKLAILAELGVHNPTLETIRLIEEQATKTDTATRAIQNHTQAEKDAAKEANSLGSAWTELIKTGKDFAALVGETIWGALVKVTQAEHDLVKTLGDWIVALGQAELASAWLRRLTLQDSNTSGAQNIINVGRGLQEAGSRPVMGTPAYAAQLAGGAGSAATGVGDVPGPARLTPEGQSNATQIVSTMYNAALQRGLPPDQARAFAQATLYAPLYESGGTLLASALQPTGPQPAGVSGSGGAVGPFQFDPIGGHYALAKQMGLDPSQLSTQLTVLQQGGYIDRAIQAFSSAGGNGYGAARAAYGALEGVPAGATGNSPELFQQAQGIANTVIAGGNTTVSGYRPPTDALGQHLSGQPATNAPGGFDPYAPPAHTEEEMAAARRSIDQSANQIEQARTRLNELTDPNRDIVTPEIIAATQKRVNDLSGQAQAMQPDIDRLQAEKAAAVDRPEQRRVIDDQLAPLLQKQTELTGQLQAAQSLLTKQQNELNSSTRTVAENYNGLNRAIDNYNETALAGSRRVTDQTIVDDQLQVESTRATADAKLAAVTDLQTKIDAAQQAGDIPAFNELQSQFGPALQEAASAITAYGNAQSRLTSDQQILRTNLKDLSTAWETYGQTTLKVEGEIEQGDKIVTGDMLRNDDMVVQSRRDAAYAQGNIVFGLLKELDEATKAGDLQRVKDLQDQIAGEQKIYNDDATNYGTAQQRKKADLASFQQEQKAEAEASRQFAADQVANNQFIVGSLKSIGLQIPDAWHTALTGASGDVQTTYRQIGVIDQALRGQLSENDRKEKEEERARLQGYLTDNVGTYNAILAAAQLYSQGQDELSKATLARVKADRAADLSDVREKNAAKLASDLARIHDSNEAQQSSLATSAEVARIQAQTYELQANQATDSVSRQRALISASVAQQTADLEAGEARQIQVVRDGEQEKFRQYNDILLQYEEAAQTSAAKQLEFQVDLDTAKAYADIATARIQMDLQEEVLHGATDAKDAEIQSLTDYLGTLPGYIKGVNDAAVAWENYGTTVLSGTDKAKAAITGLTQSSDASVSRITQQTQTSLSLLQAHSQLQSAGLGATPPQITALQQQIDKLTVIKDQEQQRLQPLQAQLTEMQDQNSVLSDQLSLQRDQFLASSAYLANVVALSDLAVQRDQAELALLDATSEADRARLADTKEQLAVLESQNAVTQAQAQLQADLAVSTDAYLSLSTNLKGAAVERDRVELALLGAVSEKQQELLDQTNERLAVLNSETAVLQAQAQLLTDQAVASEAYLNLSTELKGLAIGRDQADLAVLAATSEAQQELLDATKERLTVLQSENAVLQAQATLQSDQLAASAGYLGLSSQLKALAVERAQAEVNLLETTNAAAQVQLSVEREQLNVEQAKLSALQAQLQLSQDLTKASPDYLGLTADLNRLKVQQDALATAGLHNSALDREVQMLEAQRTLLLAQNTVANTSLDTQRAIQQVQVDQVSTQQAQTQVTVDATNQYQAQITVIDQQRALLQAQLDLLTARNTLSGDDLSQQQAIAKVQADQLNLALAEQSVVTDAQAAASLQVQMLSRQTAELQGQQKLMTDQATAAGDLLAREQALSKVRTDQLTVQARQSSIITETQAKLTLEAQTLDRQTASLQAQQKLMADQATLAGNEISKEQAKQKVQADQLTVQQAQQSIITDTVAKLTLQLGSLDRQNERLTAQQKIMTDENTAALNQLQSQASIEKVQTDQLQLQLAQVKAQTDMVNGVDATLSALQLELQTLQQIQKVSQAIVPVGATSAYPGTTGAYPGGTGSFGGPLLVPPTQPPTTSTYSSGVLVPPTQPVSPVPTTTATVQPSQAGLPVGTVFTGGPYNGYVVRQTININVGGKIVTEEVLQNLSTGQVLDVYV